MAAVARSQPKPKNCVATTVALEVETEIASPKKRPRTQKTTKQSPEESESQIEVAAEDDKYWFNNYEGKYYTKSELHQIIKARCAALNKNTFIPLEVRNSCTTIAYF
jgi:hypothetical protein